MKLAEEIIKNLKSIPGDSVKSLSQVLAALSIKNNLIIQSNSSHRNKTFLSLLHDNLNLLIPQLEVTKIISQSISSEANISQVKDQLLNQGLFSKAKLIVFLDFENLKVKFQNSILENMGENNDQLVLFFIKEGQLKALDKIKSSATLGNLPPLLGPKLEKWINTECIKLGCKGCDPLAINLLVKEFGGDKIDEIAKILSKATLLTEANAEVTVKNILDASKFSKERDMLDLFAAVAKQDPISINFAIRSIINSGTHPLQIFSYFNKAIKTLLANQDKTSSGEHSKDLHNSWFVTKLNPRLFSEERLIKALPKLAALEFGLKDNGLTPEVLLYQTLNGL